MEWLKKIGNEISHWGENAVKKTKNLSETMQLSLDIQEEERKQKECIFKIGEIFLEKYSMDAEGEMKEQCDYIEESRKKINEYREKLKEAKGTILCPNCKAHVSADAKFCIHCGQKLEREWEKGYCPNCGEKNGENSLFCTKCGFRLSFAPDEKIVRMFFVVGILQILLAILWFTNSSELNGMGIVPQSVSMHMACGEYGVISILTTVLNIFAAALSTYLAIIKEQHVHHKMLLQKVMAIWCLAFFLIFVISALTEVSSSGYEELVTFRLTIFGWLYLIDNIALVVLLFYISRNGKKRKVS